MQGRGTKAFGAGKAAFGMRLRAPIGLFCSLAVLSFSLLLVAQAGARVEASRTKTRSNTPPLVTNAYRITGDIPGELSLGERKRIKIKLANRQSFGLWVYRLRFKGELDEAHRAAGCSISRDYRFRQLSPRTFPFRIPKKRTRIIEQTIGGETIATKTLVWWNLPPSRTYNLPAIELVNLPATNQDACKGAVVTLTVNSRAERDREDAERRLKKENF